MMNLFGRIFPARADNASRHARSWTWCRSPTSSMVSTETPSGAATPTNTVPTGFPSCESGPATPVVARAYVAPVASRHPTAIAPAHSAETTPYRSTTSSGTPSRVRFRSVA